jgi:hypothetical protein
MRSAATSTNLGEPRRQRTAMAWTARQRCVPVTSPAATAGRPFADNAAEHLAEQAGGYPYAIQLYGHDAWRASQGQSEITIEAASAAARTARVELARGLYAQRCAQTPPREREYLTAVAELQAASGRVTGADVARHLEKAAVQLSSYRARLIQKGTLATRGDELFFAVPGMGAYILGLTNQERARSRRPTQDRARSLTPRHRARSRARRAPIKGSARVGDARSRGKQKRAQARRACSLLVRSGREISGEVGSRSPGQSGHRFVLRFAQSGSAVSWWLGAPRTDAGIPLADRPAGTSRRRRPSSEPRDAKLSRSARAVRCLVSVRRADARRAVCGSLPGPPDDRPDGAVERCVCGRVCLGDMARRLSAARSPSGSGVPGSLGTMCA